MNVKHTKRLVSVILAVCMLLSCLLVSGIPASAEETAYAASGAAADIAQTGATDYGLADNIQDGVILHAWNWSYDNIRANLKTIAELGYSAIQTSPAQKPKEATAGKNSGTNWWVFYQPGALSVETGSDNALGNKAQLQALTEEAHKYGIKIIVDIVANHLGNRSDASNLCDRAYSYESTIANSWLFHNNGGSNDGSVEAVVRGNIGMPDLQTENSHVQQRVLSLLKELVDVGVDGFRYDAAKHIETPDDGYYGSQFWPTVINGANSYASSTKGKSLYHYGEILNTCGAGRGYGSYTKYMSITDNTTGNNIRHSVEGRNASGTVSSHYNSGQSGNKVVLWNESHDTYANDDKESTYCSSDTLNKTWAMVASRQGASALYLARPNSTGTKLGAADKTAWANKEVGEVNKFHNYFIGKSEYLSSSGSIAYNERGTEGVVLVNVNGGSASVNVKANKMANGTYEDQVTGNTFTVSNGQISGQIGSTGIAVVYNATTAPKNTISPAGGSFKTETMNITLGLSNATSGTYQINNGAVTTYTNTTTVSIGAGVAYGSTITVKLTATDGSATESATYTFTKKDPSEGTTLYFDNSSYNWNSVYCYVYLDKTTENAAWPGVQMTYDSATGYYTYDVPDNLVNGLVIFSDNGSSNRYPAEMQPGLDIDETSKLFSAGNSWEAYTAPTQPTTQPTIPTQSTTQPTTAATQPTTPSTTEPKELVLKGDANLDNAINIKDVTLVQMQSAQMTEFNSKQKISGDVNNDGVVNIKDATIIQKFLASQDVGSATINVYVSVDGEPTEPSTTPTTTDPVIPSTEPTTTETEPAEVNYIYYRNTNNWNNVHAYYWVKDSAGPVSWPGVAMELVKDNIYRVEVPEGMNQIIFSNQGNPQTDDLTIPGWNQIYDNGNWSAYTG